MIGWLTGKALPYITAGAGILILSLLVATIVLIHSRDGYIAKHAESKQALAQAALTNANSLATIAQLQADTKWREQKAVERVQRERQSNDKLSGVIAQLEEDLKDAPCTGPEFVWPDAVYDRMRQNTVSDPNRVREADGS